MDAPDDRSPPLHMMSPRPPLAEPPDLRAALRAEPALRKVFSALAYTHQREHIEALLTAKKPETRARRLAKTLDMLRSDQPARNATNSDPADRR
ncbi:MAG: YdeI/OmpD-associated family protein [Gemmatimonadales bacterium]